jgi:tRNA dimethylallyltransferase
MRSICALTGPTGGGKSDLALRLAASLPIEIISVDSAQVYRGLDIGTAKPTLAVRTSVPHHLIDIREPEGNYSAGEFLADVARLLPEIIARQRVPLLVGGTMLYLRALITGISNLPAAVPELRAAIDAEAAERGWPEMHAELALVDREAAARIATNDAQRIQRALEVYRSSGVPLSQWHAAGAQPPPYQFVRLAVVPDRAVLHQRIEARFRSMLDIGLLDEVRSLRSRGSLTAQHPSIRSVGYRQIWAHLAGEYDLDTAILKSVAATRQLAKRQLTWLRSDPQVIWLDPAAVNAYAAVRSQVVQTM